MDTQVWKRPSREQPVPASYRVSVVICAYTEERLDQLIAAVNSVEKQSYPVEEIIVVVDHNPPLLAEVQARSPRALVIANTEARGLSGARNSGVVVARGEIVAFLDDDAVAAPDWLEQLCSGYDDPRVVGVGGLADPAWQGGRPAWFPTEFDWVVGCSYRGLPERTFPVRNLIGANMSFRREVVEGVGGFRTGVGQVGASMLRCDDTEFCIRARQLLPDSEIVYEPLATVYHSVPADRGRWSYFRTRCYTEGQAKALVSRLVGRRDGLSSEATYTLRALTKGVIRGIRDFIVSHDVAGLGRAVAIVVGFALTTAGYITATLSAASAASEVATSGGSRSDSSNAQIRMGDDAA